MEQQFVSILKGTLVAPWFWLGVAPLAFLICNYISYRRAKAKKKTKKMAARRNDIKKGIVFVVLTLALATVLTVDVVKDINNRSFGTVHGDFEKGYSSGARGSGGYAYYTVTTDDGEEFQLHVPPMCWPFEKPDLPKSGTFHGTMWYSENSHYALKFVPDED
mgnify:FL=1